MEDEEEGEEGTPWFLKDVPTSEPWRIAYMAYYANGPMQEVKMARAFFVRYKRWPLGLSQETNEMLGLDEDAVEKVSVQHDKEWREKMGLRI